MSKRMTANLDGVKKGMRRVSRNDLDLAITNFSYDASSTISFNGIGR